MASDGAMYQIVDKRLALRSSLFLGAVLHWNGCCTPARVRNMSETGALVEAAVLPLVDSAVQLVRGALMTHARVIWSDGGRCGLKFSGAVDVQRWQEASANSEQKRVDEVVRSFKASASSGAACLRDEPISAALENNRDSNITTDLRRVVALLDNLGDLLADDDELLSRYGSALQKIDIARQLIVAHADPSNATQQSDGLAGLRRSADQALLVSGALLR